jgi:hypothetical protein
VKPYPRRTCQACGAVIPAGSEVCPVCALRGALDDARETSEFDVDPTHSSSASRFDHYQLLTREAVGTLFRGWARSVSGDAAEGICLIEEGLKNLWATGTMVTTPLLLALKAEALHLANHTTEALKAIREAETSAEKRQERWWCAEPHRLRGVFIAAIGARRCKSKLRFATLSELHKSRSRLPLW